MTIEDGGQNYMAQAGNGILSRRFFLRSAAGAGLATASVAVAAPRSESMMAPGGPMTDSGAPSPFEAHVVRAPVTSAPGTTGAGVSRTPLQHLTGLITPSRLHFERHHSGIPAIDPGRHRLAVHGLVARPMAYSVDVLDRYPMVSQIQFLECSGNSGACTAPNPVPGTASSLHGLISTSEWVGVPLAVLLDEVGVDPKGRWIIAEGADAAVMARSIPLEKARDDAIVALYQNGERLRPGNGYPMRLFLPGWEGNASVKWLRSLQVADQPAMTKDETSKYTDLGEDGIAEQFTFPMGVKSLITNPSPGLTLEGAGVYAISGIAWSGAGRITRVEVSADGGRSWGEAEIIGEALPLASTPFRVAWSWNGGEATLMSRAYDESGAVQPTRSAAMVGRGPGSFYHYNGIQAWRIDSDGEASNVYV